MGYLRRQLITGALVANAIRPVPGTWTGVSSMFTGWLVTELAPHFMAGTAVDTALELRRKDRSSSRALAGVANLAALAYLTRQGMSARQTFDASLADALGADYGGELQERFGDLDWEWKTPLRQLAVPFRYSGKPVEVIKDVPYAPEHGRRGLLDVYKPQGDIAGAPVLLQVHGGAWMYGIKDQQGLPLMRHMASRGWVCIAINYRLSPRSPFPAQIVDVKRAIAWIREHGSEYGADPGFLAITGGSAGGHLAALAALTPHDPDYQPGFEDADTSIQAAVPFYGYYDFTGSTGGPTAMRVRDRFLARKVMLADPYADIEPFEKASPLKRVRKDAPPFYVIHGVTDTLVGIDQARKFVEALRETSDDVVAYTELRGTHHAFDVLPSARSQQSVRYAERFLRWAYARWLGVPTAAEPALGDDDQTVST